MPTRAATLLIRTPSSPSLSAIPIAASTIRARSMLGRGPCRDAVSRPHIRATTGGSARSVTVGFSSSLAPVLSTP